MEKLVLITGNDTLAIKARAETIIDSVKAEVKDEYALETVIGDSDNKSPMKVLEELILSIKTPPFLSSNKVIWVKHFSHFNLATGKEADKLQFKETFEDIINILQEECVENESISLIIDGPDLDRRTKIYQFFAANGKVFYLNKINQSEKNAQINVRNKIRDICNQEGVTISYDAIEFLSATVGTDTGRLSTEISKLASYVGPNQSISLNDCQEICSKSFEMANWVFADALCSKNIKRSFNALSIIIDKLIAERVAGTKPEMSMLFTAIRKFQELIRIKSGARSLSIPEKCNYNLFNSYLNKAGNSEGASIDSILFSYHPYRAFKLFEQSWHFTDKEMCGALSALLEANKELVSGNTVPRIVLENLILKVCGRG